MEDFLSQVLDVCINVAWKLVAALIILIVGNSLIKLLLKMIRRSAWAKKAELTLKNFVISLVKAGLYTLLFMTLIGIFGIPMASFVTVLASAGAAIALAFQGSLSNFAAGVLILIFKPIKVDEFVEISGDSGTVYEVGIFYTTLKTPDNKHVIIPNSTITSNSIINYSREDIRRVDADFIVAHGTDIQKVKGTLQAVFASNDMILKDPEPSVKMTEHKESAVKYTVKVWCASENYWNVKFYLTEETTKAFEKNNISIPFPQMDVHIVNQ